MCSKPWSPRKTPRPSPRKNDPYSLTSQYTGVARSVVAAIAKAVKQTGTVPLATPLGNRHQPTTIPFAAEGRIRELVFEKHRQGTICHAKHVHALLKEAFGLEVPERTIQRHLKRMGFCWLRTRNRPRSLREKAEVRQQRHDYLCDSAAIVNVLLLSAIKRSIWTRVFSASPSWRPVFLVLRP